MQDKKLVWDVYLSIKTTVPRHYRVRAITREAAIKLAENMAKDDFGFPENILIATARPATDSNLHISGEP
mgnify:CR=1 FL=1